MKQRIEELVNQSKFFANDERRYLERVHNREYSQDEWQDICFEKFAELIVRECIGIVDSHRTKMDSRPRHIIEDLKNHFGVEL